MRTYYQRLGEELALRPLIERFYHLMDEQKEFFGIRQLHSRQLDCSRARRFRFLCGLARRTDPLRLSPGRGPGIGSCAPGFPSPSRAANAISGWRGCAKTGKKSDSKGRCLGRLQLSALPDCRSMVAGPMMAPEQESLTL